jgi:outer membrane protein
MNSVLTSVGPVLPKIRLVAFAAALLLPPLALAELSDESLLGPALRIRPAYDGSGSRHGELVPALRYFGQPWFARSTQGVLEAGVRFELVPGLHGGAQLAYEPGRQASESDFLKSHGLADVDNGASLGVHLEWDHKFGPVPIALLLRSRQRTDSDRGTQADLRLSVGAYRRGPFAAGIFTQATWANTKSTGTFYDITPQQSAASGLPTFHAAGGGLFASIGALWSIDLSSDWIIVGSLESRRLQGDAARSPLAERQSNAYTSAGLAYRF